MFRGHRSNRSYRHQGFSLIELVIVVVIIAIIGAIAIPRMSRGAAGAADSALVGNLAVLRNAIDLYATEHGGTFPGMDSGTFSDQAFKDQLTQFTDKDGNTSQTKDQTHIYGPYLRKVPPLPLGANKGDNTVVEDTGSNTPGGTAGGWFYNPNTGVIKPNVDPSTTDAEGTAYVNY